MIMRKPPTSDPINNIERLAKSLRTTRRDRKLSQQLLAERAGVARRTITNAESAQNVGVRELCRIANALGYEVVIRPMDTVVFEDLSTIFKEEE
jgi:transcriptional regulator with XRE-family HTH domain